MPALVKAIGLMSGTSLDGIDAALLVTDGERIDTFGPSLSIPYDETFRMQLKGLLLGSGDALLMEQELTKRHAEAVKVLLDKAAMQPKDIGVVGFHGQTIIHRPDEGITRQLGDGSLLAALTGINVVNDFRRRDMAEGGQGAPLVPVYHAALVKNRPLPVALVNIGGVANVTWIGENKQIMAFDTGPGNALLDDWIGKNTGASCDEDGKISASGKVDDEIILHLVGHSYFTKSPPKSLDRNSFDTRRVAALSLEDGAATLAAFTVETIIRAADHFPKMPKAWFITGGGRHNKTIMRGLRKAFGQDKVLPIEEIGTDGDMTEAQAFAYLAVRSVYGLPLTFPATTGTRRPVPGGAFYRV